MWIPLLVVVFALQASGTLGANDVKPRFTNQNEIRRALRNIREDFPLEKSIVQARAEEGGLNITYTLNDITYFAIHEVTGVITLKSPWDYDTIDKDSDKWKLTLVIIATDTEDEDGELEVEVILLNVNDNKPQFDDTQQQKEVYENVTIGTKVMDLIVIDVDREKNPFAISVDCVNNQIDPGDDTCSIFELKATRRSNADWIGLIKTRRTLDFETTSSYSIILDASDGLNTQRQEYQIKLKDVNDAPPRFIIADSKTIPEGNPVGTFFHYVYAEDTDTVDARPIRYELIGNPQALSYFDISKVGGNISNKVELDYEGPIKSFTLEIKAMELLKANPEVLGDDPSTTAVTSIRITLLDVNDNCPVFGSQQYNVKVEENKPGDYVILRLPLSDLDETVQNRRYEVSLTGGGNRFKLDTKFDDRAPTILFLQVADSRELDFETAPKNYRLTITARDKGLSRCSESTEVNIALQDVNDVIPVFRTDYEELVSELAPEGLTVVKVEAEDRETGIFGKDGFRYDFTSDSTLFSIDHFSGVVKVRQCATPGTAPCLDYENERLHSLTVMVVDNEGNTPSLTAFAALRIKVGPENDNIPRFTGNYIRYIQETETDPKLRVQATDRDLDPLTFSLDLGRDADFWNIDPNNGTVMANMPILMSDTQGKGAFHFEARAFDGLHEAIATIEIRVIDINDNRPVFTDNRTVSIHENVTDNYCFTKMTATDADSSTSTNGQLTFSIESGSNGKFVINSTEEIDQVGFVAEICTASEAIIDYDQQAVYYLILKVRDKGSPRSETGTATLTVSILDINDKNPFFDPPTRSVSVSENVPSRTSVTQVTVKDNDRDSQLVLSFGRPILARDAAGTLLTNPALYQGLFTIDNNGVVSTNAPLDRDIVASMEFPLIVVDVKASPRQTGTGSLYIRILEYNDQAPQFELPFYRIDVIEESPIGYLAASLLASDEDDQISLYQLTANPQNLFHIGAQTGTLIVNGRLDYEARHSVTLTAKATDSGSPPLSNRTTIFINIININDNAPVFTEPIYQLEIPENSQQTGVVYSVFATDRDEGDFGVVRYTANDTYFRVDEITGEIFLKPGNYLDREKFSTHAFEVTAYDSPLNASVRLNTTTQVYVILGDINDHCPEFVQSNDFAGTIIETADIGDQVLEMFADDEDYGVNAGISFSIDPASVQPPDGFNLFSILSIKYPASGRIVVDDNLRNKSGMYSFVVVASDQNGQNITGDMCSTRVNVTIRVQEAINDAPIWVLPPTRNFSIDVLEEQYRGMLVYDCKARDINTGKEGIVDYYLNVRQSLKNSNAEFRINKVTCVISAKIVFDREQVSSYALTLVAKDQGNPSASSETVLIVNILDVNDNEPQFPMRNGETIPQTFTIREGEVPNMVGFVSATDKDSDHRNNKVYYRIVAGNDEGLFILGRETGVLRLSARARNGLDREAKSVYFMDILAYNDVNDDTVIRYRRKRSTNPSLVTVSVVVQDVNDTPPKFLSTDYYGCVPRNAPFGQSILRVEAEDQDEDQPLFMTYSKVRESTNGFFTVDSTLGGGTIRNAKLLNDIDSRVATLRIRVNDNGNQGNTAETDVKVFVTDKDNEVMLVVSQPSADVRYYKDQLVRAMINTSSPTPINYVCIRQVRDHIEDDGSYSYITSDVFLSAVKLEDDDDYAFYSGSKLQGILQGQLPKYKSLHVKSVEMDSDDDGLSLTEDPVLAIFIIAILLIFLALIIFLLACCLIRNSKRKKMKKLRAEERRPVEVVMQQTAPEVGTNVNPVYDNKGFEDGDEYATVQKKRPAPEAVAPPIVPVMVPAVEPEPTPEIPVVETEEPVPYIITAPVMVEEEPEMQPPPEDFFIQEPEVVTVVSAEEPEPVIETVIEADVPSDNDDYQIPEASRVPTSFEDEIDVEFGDMGDSSPPRSPSPPSDDGEEYHIETDYL